MATTVPPPSTAGIMVLPFVFAGQLTATKVGAASFRLPCPAKVLGVSATARASGGATPTLAVDVTAGGVSLLAAPFAVTAAAIAEAVVAGTGRIGDEATVAINLTVGGDTPTWDDVTVLLTVARV